MFIQLGEEALQTVHRTFAPDILVIFHLPALVDSSIHSDSLPTLYVIQEGINCMETTDYFFTNIKPALIIVTHPAATQDPISQQTCPLQPGKARVHPSMLINKQVPVLNLTETSITSQADLQDAFQSLCLCSHGRKESSEDKSAE